MLTGADASKFTVVEDAGKFYLAFVSAPDFETPGDTGLDNTYDVSVAVKDGTGAGALTSTATALSVSVTNVNEAPTVYTEVDTSTNNNDNAAAADAFALDQNGHATVIGSVKGGNNDYFLFDTDFFTIANATAGQTITLDLHDNEMRR